MIKGMYAGISGMKSQQTKLDVIGNNLANVGTTGFKSSRVVFKDMLYQNSSNAVGASNNLGGSNAKQVGLGVSIGSIDRIMAQGMMQPTGRALDVAMDGDGFFMVAKGPVAHEDVGLGVSIGSIDRIMAQGMMQPTGRALDVAMDGDGFFMVAKGPVAHEDNDITLTQDGTIQDAGGREIFYTRDGSLSLDSEGYLVTSSGERVLGYSMKSNGTQGMDANGKINFIDSEDPNLEAAEGLKTLRIPDSVEMNNGTTRKVMSYSIGKDGLITAVVEGGEIAVLGQLATASFKNPEGLEAVGKLWEITCI